MGNDEAIIYGDRHGEHYKEFVDKGDDRVVAAERQFYPNAIKVSSIGGRDIEIGVITFDQSTGERDYGWDDPERVTSLFTHLDRQGVNRLIRDLRRMRDRVFGKDE